jgi:hypothetical protein
MDELVDLLAVLAPAAVGVVAIVLGAWLARAKKP